MPRYRIIIEYDGTPFVGWQAQPCGLAVQSCLEAALGKLTGNQAISVRGAGRTDTGVHASGQVAHFDLEREWPPFKLREALNFHLKPNPIVILDAAVVAADFDARFSAIARHYCYRILARRAPPALLRDRVWWVPQTLDVQAMAAGARHLLGRHDFTTFRAAGCQAKSPIKTIDRIDVTAIDEEIRIETSARSFMHRQVRSFVGSLKHVGEGKWAPDQMRVALEARDRAMCGALAPPRGLYLTRVDYPSTLTPITSVPDDADRWSPE